jgi:hypothetical protein
MMIATRVKDFGRAKQCRNGAVLKNLERKYGGQSRFSGWATFSYNDYMDAVNCPEGCCGTDDAPTVDDPRSPPETPTP